MKVLAHQVQKVMQLVVSTQKPQFLDLLQAIVKVEELNLPLKRNQGYVMKYFMQLRDKVAYVIDQPTESRCVTICMGKSHPCENNLRHRGIS
jgi:inositol 1,4,5-triphosphate receptor type 1